MKIKHPQSILGTFNSMYASIGAAYNLGWNVLGKEGKHSIEDWFRQAQNNHVVAQRSNLELNPLVRQILPYTIIVCEFNGVLHYLAYTRLEGGGEAKLHGKVSIGWAGHIDYADIFSNDKTSVVSVAATVIGAQLRELEEELKITHYDDTPVKFLDVFHSRIATGLILQNSDPEVYHAGLTTVLEVKNGYTFKTGENQQIELIGWVPADKLLEEYGTRLEAWSKIALESEHLFDNKTNYRDLVQLENLGTLDKHRYFIEETMDMSFANPEHEAKLIDMMGGYIHQSANRAAAFYSGATPLAEQKRELQRQALEVVLGEVDPVLARELVTELLQEFQKKGQIKIQNSSLSGTYERKFHYLPPTLVPSLDYAENLHQFLCETNLDGFTPEAIALHNATLTAALAVRDAERNKLAGK